MRNPFGFAILLLPASLACGAMGATKDWKVGHVVDAMASNASYATGMSTTGTADTSNTAIKYTHVKTNDLIIAAGEDYVYNVEDSTARGFAPPAVAIGRAVANRHHGCRFIVGDAVKYSQEKDKLIVLDADGKQCKMEILRQAIVQKPNPGK